MNRKTAFGISLLVLAGITAALLICLPKRDTSIPISPPETAETEKKETDYTSKIDFEKLRKKNPDICGWLSIPGTEIDYPVLQNPEDDYLYMYHNADRQEDKNGALFTEHEYNGTDFTDPVTIIYGHHMKSGAMFGNLQQMYTDDFEAYRDVVVYTPAAELHYRVFAAVPYSNRHILYFYDKFPMQETIEEFVDELLSIRAIGSTVDDTVEVETGDRFLVLSTCLQGDNTKRFLVVGKLVGDEQTA